MIKILMLVNWKIEYSDSVPKDKQPPDYYVEGQPYWFFRYFVDKNINVDVVDIHSCKFLEQFEKDKIRFYIFQTLKVMPKLKEYDYVISHGMQSGIVLCLLRRFFGKGRYKHIVFDIGAFNSAKESGKALKLMRFASKSLDGVIYHTQKQIEYYRKYHPWLVNKSKFIPFGTDLDFFDKSEKNDSLDKASYILCVGYYKRDWVTLLEAYENSKQIYKLLLLGNKEITSTNPNVVILDGVGVNEYKELIANAEFCVLPLEDFNYSFGQMTLLQQMAMGKAVIVADVPSVRTYIEYSNDKALVKYAVKNVSQLRDKLDMLMTNKDRCAQIGESAQKLIADEFNEELMAKRIEKAIYEF